LNIGIQLVLLVVVIVFAIAGYFIWDRRYRGAEDGTFKPTAEVFIDPTTGQRMRVYEDPRTSGSTATNRRDLATLQAARPSVIAKAYRLPL
jgi:hypothetical protein